MKNQTRVRTARTRIEGAIRHLNFILEKPEIPGHNYNMTRKRIEHGIKNAIYDLKNAKTLLEKTSFIKKER